MKEAGVSSVGIKILLLLTHFFSLMHIINCLTLNLLLKLQNCSQSTIVHYNRNFHFFFFLTQEEVQHTETNEEINLWYIREAVSKLFLLQMTAVHIYFSKETVFMSQSS